MSYKYEKKEYDAGAFLLMNGYQIADFLEHLDCEEVLRLIEIGQKYEFLEQPGYFIDDIYEGEEPDWREGDSNIPEEVRDERYYW